MLFSYNLINTQTKTSFKVTCQRYIHKISPQRVRATCHRLELNTFKVNIFRYPPLNDVACKQINHLRRGQSTNDTMSPTIDKSLMCSVPQLYCTL